MATPDDNKLAEKFSFILRVLKHTELPKPDWKAITTEEGFSRPDKPRDKFRKILKDLSFDYVDDQIVDLNSTGGDAGVKEGSGTGAAKKATTTGAKETKGTAETPNSKKRKAPTKKAANGASAKKTKVSKSADGDGDDCGVLKDEAADEEA